MTYDASNRKDIRRAEKLTEELNRERINFLGAALTTKAGRAYFYHLIAECHAFVNVPSFEPYRDYTALGERNVGLRLFNEILTNFPDALIQMQKEENERLYITAARDARADAANNATRDPSELDYSRPDPYDGYVGEHNE